MYDGMVDTSGLIMWSRKDETRLCGQERMKRELGYILNMHYKELVILQNTSKQYQPDHLCEHPSSKCLEQSLSIQCQNHVMTQGPRHN